MQEIEIKSKPQETGITHSSKGNQLKWLHEGYWYKADGLGYESLAETVCSRILQHSTLKNITVYEPVSIRYNDRSYRGCGSRNFKEEGENLIPIERLYRVYTGSSLAGDLAKISDISSRISFVVDFVERATGLEQFGAYLTAMLEMDAFFFNEDRHTNNIAVLYNENKKSYRLCPYFDMGMSLCADFKGDYPLEMDYLKCMEQVKAKPFSRDFDEQMDAAELLYGRQLGFLISANKMEQIVKEAGTDGYQEMEVMRAAGIVRQQARKYRNFVP